MAARFGDALRACIEAIPPGQVATCGTIARALGDVRAARAVAQWLREHPDLDPMARVVTADGRPVLGSVERTPDPRRIRGSAVTRPPAFATEIPPVPLLAELRAQQTALAARVREVDAVAGPDVLGGADVAYRGDRAFAAAVLLDARTLNLLEVQRRVVDVDFPYIPSYLAFREFPAIRGAVQALHEKPDLLFIDGHGRLHPALFGFACFAGVSLDLATIGIAKHPLVGTPAPARRSPHAAIPIELQGAIRGYAWNPPGAARALYVSVGHGISLASALLQTQRATRRGYPEPLVVADRISKEGKEKKNAEGNASGPTAPRRTPAQRLGGA